MHRLDLCDLVEPNVHTIYYYEIQLNAVIPHRTTAKSLETMITIRNPVEFSGILAVRALFEEYQAAINVNLCFQNFAEELATLPGSYAPPEGRILIAETSTDLVGCVALRPLNEVTCEMKRLFVRDQYRSTGIGRRLVEKLIASAREIGYQRMVLDTLPTMTSAQRLYETLGFTDTAPYIPNHVEGTRYMSLKL
jgi:ribosomal protein S18 acetylase RimI-like enzyme